MPSEYWREDVRKAMAYDLICIFEQEPDETFTAAELEKLIHDYISGSQQGRTRAALS